MSLQIQELGARVVKHRGVNGVRAAAAEIGVSPATLSRVENGHVPDLATFAKICEWLGEDPAVFLGLEASGAVRPPPTVHMRKKNTTSVDTATALGAMIVAVQNAIIAREEL
ncbi:helix-turn-helix domain-containing protein [Vannielia litorea]|uniref:helix-turn-helix domain-containing protein n=1 Tax=Vannielia litorea TaxID=1217970 RepID=UPI001C98B17E|nr:helix-turn-helix domain-containing protein [Vannielia litorea]MBY6077294.1 helix-turn-helix domain-containing protein [Vannielia litorea]